MKSHINPKYYHQQDIFRIEQEKIFKPEDKKPETFQNLIIFQSHQLRLRKYIKLKL